MDNNLKNLDKRARAATIVSALVLIGLIWYGIQKGKKAGFFLLTIFVLAPAAGWLTAAATGPMIMEVPTTKEETKA